MTSSFAYAYAGVGILISMILGGGTRQGLWTDHVIAIALLPALFAGLPHLFSNRLTMAGRVLALCILAVIASQFVPVHRTADIGGLTAQGWAFRSPLPDASLESGLYAISLLGFALFLARMDEAMQERCLRFILTGLVVNLVAGAIQFSFDRRVVVSGILPFDIAAGLFANENHFSALVYSMIPLVACLCLGRKKRIAAYLVFSGFSAGILFAAGSRAGMAIATALCLVCFAWFTAPRPAFAGKAMMLAGSAALLAAALWASQRAALSQDQRWTFFATTGEAIGDNWLGGSGLGTFREVYAGHEAPDVISRTFANHAHNDYLEILLETGVAGIALILLFLAIIMVHGGRSAMAQAAFIAVAALLLHSGVDYPLRSYAVAIPFVWMIVVIASAGGGRRQGLPAKMAAADRFGPAFPDGEGSASRRLVD